MAKQGNGVRKLETWQLLKVSLASLYTQASLCPLVEPINFSRPVQMLHPPPAAPSRTLSQLDVLLRLLLFFFIYLMCFKTETLFYPLVSSSSGVQLLVINYDPITSNEFHGQEAEERSDCPIRFSS
jgi:hypothetical protein